MAQFINPRKKPEGQGSTTPVTLVGSANSVTLSGAVDTELTTADLDTGAASDVHAVVGLVGSASGGGQIIPGSSTDGLLVNLGANNDVDTELSAAAALSDNFANPTAGGVGAFGMLWDGATWDRSPGNSTDGLLVNLGANNDVTITALPGDVEADIDQIRDQIDLITPDVEEIRVDSDAIRVAVEIMDDWDESDRAKVNPIAGQAGVQGGAGAVTALTQRIAIATDANTVDTELTTADLDTGAGTDTRAVVGLVFAASGGATLVSAAAPLPVTATATVAGSVDTELPDAAALADNTANPTTTSVGAFPHWWDGATWDRAAGTAADGLLVNLGTNNDVTVTGSVTANAGTNLNTSLLALEAGGNLAAAAASLSVVDDWDESDRAKVNPIAGQAGVQGGAGAVTALTQRVAIATDANAVKITDGTDTADVIDSGTFAGLGVYILDGAGDPITSFGGGTQYTEGDTDASITGTAAMWEDGSDTLRAISMAKPLPVQPGTSVAFPVTDNSGSLTVDGTVAVSSVGGTVAVTQSGTWDEVGINDSGNSITVDNAGTFAVQADTELPAAAALADNTANPTAPAVGSFGHVWDGATWDRTPGNSTDGVTVNLGANNDVTVTGTVAVSSIGAGTNNIGDVDVLSVVPGTGATNLGKAEDAGHSSGDVGVMALGVRQDAVSALAADGDYIPLSMDSNGALRVAGAADAFPGVRSVQVAGWDGYEGASIALPSPKDQRTADYAFVPGGGYSEIGVPYTFLVDSAGIQTVSPVGTGALVGGGTAVLVIPTSHRMSDTYTAAATGTSSTMGGGASKYALQVVQSGTVSAWDVRIEGSLDNSTWFQVIQHTQADGSGTIKWAADKPCYAIRSRCASITLGAGTNVGAYVYISTA